MALVPWTYSNPHVDRNKLTTQQFTFFGKFIEITQDTTTDINIDQNTGFKLWDGAYLLAFYIEKHLDFLQGKKCIELGAGCGVVSLVAWLAGADVIATDLPDILTHTRRVVDKNVERIKNEDDSIANSIRCMPLDWSDPPKMELRPDVILGSDIIYHPKTVDLLVQTLMKLSSQETEIYISYKPRGLGEDIFFHRLEENSFVYEVIDKACYPPDFSMSSYVINKIKKV